MIISIFLLILGFIFLINGAEIFIEGASSTAQNFKVSKVLIGLTIVGFGTSAPELAISLSALANNNTDMVLGNVIGSNIMNTLLILGVAAVILPIKIKDNTVRKELPLTLLISTLLVVIFLDISLANGTVNEITRSDAIVILLFFLVFIYYLVTLAKNKKDGLFTSNNPKYGIVKSLALIITGIAGIIIGSNLVVNNASNIAKILNFSDRLIALTIIAFGTSLPELVTTIVSSKKGEQDLLIGNIIGSNIFNICVVLGIPVILFGTITPASFKTVDLGMLIISSILLLIFSTTHRTISRLEGILLLTIFTVYYILVFVI